MVIRPDRSSIFQSSDMSSDHDAGLEHNHHWAGERITARRHNPVVADAASMRTPSSVTHDDAIYFAS